MTKPKDITGHRYGILTAIRRLPGVRDNVKNRRNAMWLCQCDCGSEVIRSVGHLRNIKSCGCLHSKQGGLCVANLSEYSTWRGMQVRCYDSSARGYHRYGGRGIRVCDRWRQSFACFLEDMGPRPSPDHELDREDNDGNYEPDNCRWVTHKVNSGNRETTHAIEIDGVVRCLADWIDIMPISKATVYRRIRRGWTPKRAVSTPRGSLGRPKINPPPRRRV